MHHVLGEDGERRFPTGKRLISHWNLRDELKANYADEDGLAKQRTIVKVMERIVTQTIPRAVIDNPRLDWNPFTNAGDRRAGRRDRGRRPPTDQAPDRRRSAREPDARFAQVLAHFRAARRADRVLADRADARSPARSTAPRCPRSGCARCSLAMLESPLVARGGQGDRGQARPQARAAGPLVRVRRRRRARGRARRDHPQALSRPPTRSPPTCRASCATSASRADAARSTSPTTSRSIRRAAPATRWRRARRGDKPHLRTRVEAGGMDYKGYNIAVHELGHNVEQTFSLYDVDHTLLAGVPEHRVHRGARVPVPGARPRAARPPDARAARPSACACSTTSGTRWEIAGSALVEIDVWHWLYEHPERDRGRAARGHRAHRARDLGPLLRAGARRQGQTALLGIYCHTISSPLYLFNYVLGHLIAFQIEEHLARQGQRDVRRRVRRGWRGSARSCPTSGCSTRPARRSSAAAAARRHRARGETAAVRARFATRGPGGGRRRRDRGRGRRSRRRWRAGRARRGRSRRAARRTAATTGSGRGRRPR